MVDSVLVRSRGSFVVRIGILTVQAALWVIFGIVDCSWKEIQSTFFKRVDIETQRTVDIREVHRLAAFYASKIHLLVSALLDLERLVCG